jgi:RNA polymerase primary sigma factor
MTEDSLGRYLKDIGRYPLLNGSQEIQLARQLKSPNQRISARARNKLFCCNLRLVVSIAKHFSRMTQSLDVLDLIQSGNIGLGKAIPKYDPERGYKFSTYASNWINAEIRREIANTDRIIRLPVNTHDQIIKYRKIATEIGVGGVTQAMQESGASTSLVLAALQHSSRPASLDARAFEDGSTLLEMLEIPVPTPETMSPEHVALSDAMGLLSDRERAVVERYYGLGKNHPASMREISEGLGITRQAATKIRNRALRRLHFCLNTAK